ncbi:MAG: hypothetical protein ACFFD2_15135 [Promethearchaeota archaeon]
MTVKVIKKELAHIMEEIGRYPTEEELRSMGKEYLIKNLRELKKK